MAEPSDTSGLPPAQRSRPTRSLGSVLAAPFTLMAKLAGAAERSPEERDGERAIARRKFLAFVSLGVGGVGAAMIGVPVLAFLLAPLFESIQGKWRTVGHADQFQPGKTLEVKFEDASSVAWAGVTAQTAAWLRRDESGQFVAFAVNCTHLGCPVRWLEQAELFMCPCHGGVYYKDGTVAAGPPPRPLTHYPVRVRDGQVEILTMPTPIA
jgi:menaquinol-cytochrome c reductase iron-sulfur subunit